MQTLYLKLNPFQGKESACPEYVSNAAVEEGACFDYLGKKILKDQYLSLIDIVTQLGRTIEEVFEDDNSFNIMGYRADIGGKIAAEKGLLKLIALAPSLDLNSGKKLIIPANLSYLEYFECIGNRICSLTLPETLVNLKKLRCDVNLIRYLEIPANLANLRDLQCTENRISCLKIPKAIYDNLKVFNYDKKKTKLVIV